VEVSLSRFDMPEEEDSFSWDSSYSKISSEDEEKADSEPTNEYQCCEPEVLNGQIFASCVVS
jgi:hypothetical protein